MRTKMSPSSTANGRPLIMSESSVLHPGNGSVSVYHESWLERKQSFIIHQTNAHWTAVVKTICLPLPLPLSKKNTKMKLQCLMMIGLPSSWQSTWTHQKRLDALLGKWWRQCLTRMVMHNAKSNWNYHLYDHKCMTSWSSHSCDRMKSAM